MPGYTSFFVSGKESRNVGSTSLLKKVDEFDFSNKESNLSP